MGEGREDRRSNWIGRGKERERIRRKRIVRLDCEGIGERKEKEEKDVEGR